MANKCGGCVNFEAEELQCELFDMGVYEDTAACEEWDDKNSQAVTMKFGEFEEKED